jgi:hypothetical protein
MKAPPEIDPSICPVHRIRNIEAEVDAGTPEARMVVTGTEPILMEITTDVRGRVTHRTCPDCDWECHS